MLLFYYPHSVQQHASQTAWPQRDFSLPSLKLGLEAFGKFIVTIQLRACPNIRGAAHKIVQRINMVFGLQQIHNALKLKEMNTFYLSISVCYGVDHC